MLLFPFHVVVHCSVDVFSTLSSHHRVHLKMLFGLLNKSKVIANSFSLELLFHLLTKAPTLKITNFPPSAMTAGISAMQ